MDVKSNFPIKINYRVCGLKVSNVTFTLYVDLPCDTYRICSVYGTRFCRTFDRLFTFVLANTVESCCRSRH
jgi:hypothetical protein